MYHPTSTKTTPQKIVWHLKVFAAALFIAMAFSFILQQQFFHREFPMMLAMTYVQLEIFIWLGAWYFESVKPGTANYRKKIVVRLLLFYLTVLAVAFLVFFSIFLLNVLLQGGNFKESLNDLLNYEMQGFLIATMVGFGFGALFFFYAQWSDSLKREQQLEQEKLIFQHETLKNQVNPHFLFNSLNTLSSLVSTDSQLSEKFIQKLSSVYRYVLENKDKELVPLSTEIEFVKNFFYLQKIRDQEKIELEIENNGNTNVYILPVSLQMLVENALKHNQATRKEPLKITIHFEGLDKLVVRNDLRKKTKLEKSSRLGLNNLNERCRLTLHREIEVKETPDEFIVKVPVTNIKDRSPKSEVRSRKK